MIDDRTDEDFHRDIRRVFGTNAYVPTTDNFKTHIQNVFGPETQEKIFEIIEKLNLQIPEARVEFMQASSGALLVLDDYACVLRIEQSDKAINEEIKERGSYLRRGRRVDHPLVLQPLGSIDLGEATIEICPGTRTNASEELSEEVKDILMDDGVDYWDDVAQNIGILPVKTEDFPDGVPVVIDRLAVNQVSEIPKEIMVGFERNNFQQSLYQPLYQKFQDAVFVNKSDVSIDAEDIKSFWQSCAEFKSKYKLIPGWQFYEDRVSLPIKQREAITAGQEYKQRLAKKPPII